MFSARSEQDAVSATLLFNVAHYAVRPWPWILVALGSLIVYPELSDLSQAFPSLSPDKVGHDMAYPAMLTHLPPGWLGLMAASLLAAFISTMSTQVNLGASYLVHDFWARFIRPGATEADCVRAGRWATVLSLAAGATLSLALTSASQAFQLLLLLGAGTGGLFLLRWFWWRISAKTEIAAMVLSLIVAVHFTWVHDALGLWPLEDWQKLVLGSVLTTAGWVLAAWALPPEAEAVLQRFAAVVKPPGKGWKRFTPSTGQAASIGPHPGGSLPLQLLQSFLGCLCVFQALFGVGATLGLTGGWPPVHLAISALSFFWIHRIRQSQT